MAFSDLQLALLPIACALGAIVLWIGSRVSDESRAS